MKSRDQKLDFKTRLRQASNNPLIIAEVGNIHEGSFGQAKAMIDAVAATGADVVKFQTHMAEYETTKDAPSPPYFRDESRYEYFQRIAFTPAQWRALVAHARSRGLWFASSPFCREAVDILEAATVDAYKIASGEVTNLPLLERIRQTGKPVILSSGMSDIQELRQAVKLLRRNPLVVLQCTSLYPCPYEKVGLNVIAEFRKLFRVPVGLSDHTLDLYSSYAAVAVGAEVIEKHFTLSKKMYGPDPKFSLDPAEFTALVAGCRAIATMRREPVVKNDLSQFREMRKIFLKSIVAAKDIQKGERFTDDNLTMKKPGTGLAAVRLPQILGRVAKRGIKKDSLVLQHDF